MGKENNLNDFLKDLYVGIASKKPDASKNPQNFRSEIEAIETGSNGSAIEVSTEAEMTALLETAEIGTIYKYTGESGTYKNAALYVVEEGE